MRPRPQRTCLATVDGGTVTDRKGFDAWASSRWRLAWFSAGVAALAYVGFAIWQLAAPATDRITDFRDLYGAASALNHGRDPYGAWFAACPTAFNIDHCPGYLYPPLLAELFRPFSIP